jgi:hypothetical protein
MLSTALYQIDDAVLDLVLEDDRGVILESDFQR